MGDFLRYKYVHIRQKLLDPRSTGALSMTIRPQLEDIENRLFALVHRTLFHDDNTSVIIYGPKGSGKTLVVERVVRKLEEEFNLTDEISVLCLVRLSGALEKNQRDGFKSIVCQICKFVNLEYQNQCSAQENIQFLKTILVKLKESNRTCLMVLEDFEHFVRNSEKQEVLYTLLDALQSNEIKIDFNKRVVSRFSNKMWSIPKVANVLTTMEEQKPFVMQTVDPLETLHSMLLVSSTKKFKAQISKYQKSLQEALKDVNLQSRLKDETLSLSVSDLRDIALLSIASARDSVSIASLHISEALNECLRRLEPMVEKIASLSVPQLYMLVSSFLLKSDFTHKAAYGKYDCFIKTQNTSEIYSESLMIHAFEDLYHEGFLISSKLSKLVLLSPLDHFNLNFTRDELWKGLSQNPLTSTVLQTFFRSD